MSIKLVDTLEPMADFPAAMAENMGFADGKTLQEKYDSGELGGNNGTPIVVDSNLDTTSINPVQNKVIASKIKEIEANFEDKCFYWYQGLGDLSIEQYKTSEKITPEMVGTEISIIIISPRYGESEGLVTIESQISETIFLINGERSGQIEFSHEEIIKSNGINDSVVSSESTWSSVKTRDTISSLLNDNEASIASTWTGSKIDNELNTIKDAVTSLESREEIPIVTNGKDVVLRKITQNRSITDLPPYLNSDGSKGYKVDDLYFTYDTHSLALGIKAWLTDNGITPAKGSTYADVAQIKVYIPSAGGYTYLSTKFSFDNSTYLSYSVEYKGTDYRIVSCQYDYNTSEVNSETFTGLNVFNLATLIPALSNGYIQEDILTVFHNWFSIYKLIGIQDVPGTFSKTDAILTQDTIASTTMDSKKVGTWDLGNLVSFATGSLQRLIFTVNPEGTKLAAYANKETDRTGVISGDFFGKNLLAPLNTFEVLDDMSTLPTPPSGALGVWTVKPGAAGQPESSNVGDTLIIAYITGSLYSTSIEYIGTRIALYFTKGAMYYALGYGGKYYPTSSWNASSGGDPMWYKIASTLV